MKSPTRNAVVPADPSLWSEQSQRSVSAGWTKEYRDIHYQCWRCKADAVFSAQDQKYTYEVLKAPIDQQRVLCEECWRKSISIAKDLKTYEERWSEEKPALRQNREFLASWLKLLETREEYVAYKPDTAKKNMLRKLLGNV